jgi:NAD-dependent deacetylase
MASQDDESSTLLARARALVDAATRITVLTGAGISTDSGIPDFRGPNGLWTRNPDAEKASRIDFYVADSALRQRNWAARASGTLWADVKPNAGHHALVALQARAKLHTLITQNVDELHQLAGVDPELVVEIHGTTRKAGCLSCDYRVAMIVVLDRVRAGEPDPDCPVCGGILKSATISFGQALVPHDLARAERAATECDLLLAIGSSLQVYPIAAVVPLAVQSGAALVIVNGEPTPFDELADVVLNDGISDVLPALCRAS